MFNGEGGGLSAALRLLKEVVARLTRIERRVAKIEEIEGGTGDVSSGDLATVATTGDYDDLINVPSTFAPSAHASSHQHGGTDEIATATPGANAIVKADADGKIGAGWIDDADINLDNVTEGTTNKFFTASDETKLGGIEAGAEVNTVDSVNGQTGTVVLDPDDLDDSATTNKFTTAGDISKLTGIEAGANLYVHPNHSGDVTSVGDGAQTIANNAVGNTKIRDSGALSVIGRSANSTGDPADISASAASDAVLRESGSTLGFGTIATAGIADAAVTLAKMANLAESTVIGRAAGAGTGVPTALSVSQLNAIIDSAAIFLLLAGRSGGQRVTGIASTGYALEVYRDLAAASTDSAVLAATQDNVNDDQPAFRTQQDGTGALIAAYDGAVLVFELQDNGVIEAVAIQQTSVRELLQRWRVQGLTDASVFIANLTTNNTNFAPGIGGYAEDTGTSPLTVIGYIVSGLDSGTTPVMVFDARRSSVSTLPHTGSASAVATRPLFRWANAGTQVMQIDADGKTAIGSPSSTLARLHVQAAAVGNAVQRLESIATNDDPAEIVYQGRAATTNNMQTTLLTVTIDASTTYYIEAVVIARRTGGTSGTAEDGAVYKLRASVKNVSGTATLIGGTATTAYSQEDQSGWDATIDVTGATARVRVTGATNNNVTWHCTARVYPVSS